MRPTKVQEAGLYQMAGARRFAYNWALSRRKEHYSETGKTLSYNRLAGELTGLKEEKPWLKGVDSQMLQQALKDVDRAFRNFFEKRSRFPKFRSRKAGAFTFRIPQRVKVEGGKVYVPKVGWVRIRQSREIEGQTKSATFKRDASGHWYVSLVSEFDMPEVALPPPRKAVGIDLGLSDFAVTSEAERIEAPRFFRKGERRLAKAAKDLSRKQKGSRRREKAKSRVARLHRKVANQRSDFLHKLTTEMVRHYDCICVEDLDNRALAKTKLSKSILDASFGECRRQLSYKSLWSRRHYVEIDRFFPSSKLCGACGAINTELTLGDRSRTCGCGITHDRDENAAQNIEAEGLRMVAAGQTDTLNARGGPVSLPTGARLDETRIHRL